MRLAVTITVPFSTVTGPYGVTVSSPEADDSRCRPEQATSAQVSPAASSSVRMEGGSSSHRKCPAVSAASVHLFHALSLDSLGRTLISTVENGHGAVHLVDREKSPPISEHLHHARPIDGAGAPCGHAGEVRKEQLVLAGGRVSPARAFRYVQLLAEPGNSDKELIADRDWLQVGTDPYKSRGQQVLLQRPDAGAPGPHS